MRLFTPLFGMVLAARWICDSPGQSSQETFPRPDTSPPPLTLKLELQGAGSCASMACHNADALTGFTGREYKIVFERDFSGTMPCVKDKHAQAFAVLFEERSHVIARNWRQLAPGAKVQPERETLCLRCHVHAKVDAQPMRRVDGVAQFRLEDGVSCEACHGPAERWLAAHFRPEFKNLSAAGRHGYGMYDTRSVAGRARVCVDCHVGAPGAEVNHDLIAAGHPRLNFEFSNFQYMLHKHWDYAKDNDPARDPRGRKDFEARSWAVGQLVSAVAALRLLADRAGDERRPWIELAEYNCFACHHDLRPESWRQRNYAKGQAGKLSWSPWYYALVGEAVEALGPSNPNLSEQLRAIAAELESPQPNRDRTAKLARQTAQMLEALLQRESASAELLPVEVLLHKALERADTKSAQSWDHAMPRYAVLAALARARRDLRQPTPELRPLANLLRFPLGVDSPRDYDPAKIEDAIRILKQASQK